ncbi:MAG TPA: carboxypeptidase regulatory-like domain-containing protein [Acidobacteriaceae bacterium]
MSDFYQPGQHPDADQLSAFAEDALPAHEREQTLAHLAGCADCRTIVSLALPPVEDVPQLQPAAANRPWFYGWNVAWLAGAGLAALVFLTVHIRNGGRDGRIASTPTQTAAVRPQAAPVAPPAWNAAPSMGLKTSRAVAAPPPPKAADRFPSSATPATIDSRQIANLPIQGRNFIAEPQQQQQSQQQAGGLHGSVYGASAGAGVGGRVARDDQSQFAQRGALNGRNNDAARAAAPAPVAAAPMMRAPIQPAPAAAAKATPQTSDAVTVAAARAQVETTNASVSTMLTSPGMVDAHRLPSHLAIASTITRANRMLALDTAGALFLSKDGGRHWKAVAAQWQGRAVKIELASLPLLPAKQPASATIDGNASASDLANLDSKAISGPSVAGVVNDSTGAIISGVFITVKDARTGTVQTTATDRNGHYAVAGLAPGAYRIDASEPGFASWRGTVTVAAAQQSVVNISLTVGAVSETVEVSSEPPMMTDNAERKARKAEKSSPLSEPSAIFEITTDNGEIWTSADGKKWTRK